MSTINTAMSEALKNVSAPVAPATAGISLQSLMAQMQADREAHAKQMADMMALLETAKSQSVKIIRIGSNDGKTWFEKQFLGTWTKGALAGKPKFQINAESIKSTDDAAIALNVGPARQYGAAVLLVKGKRKGIFLSASALGAIVGASGMLASFAKDNHEAITAAFVAEAPEADE